MTSMTFSSSAFSAVIDALSRTASRAHSTFRLRLSAIVFAVTALLSQTNTNAVGVNGDCVNNGVQGSPFSAGSGSVTVTGGQVSGAGATLFVDFFRAPASTNDWIDVDGDNNAGFLGVFPFTDNLGTIWPPNGTISTYWMFQYRSVGSVNGFNEFVDLDSLKKSTKATALFIAEWCGVEKA